MIERIRAVLRKELLEGVRDRRSAAAALIYALVGPMVLFTVLTGLARESEPTGPDFVAMRGVAEVQGLAALLVEYGIVPGGEDSPVRLEVPPDFSRRLGSGDAPSMTITADLGKSEATVQRIRDAVAGYDRLVASQRLVARGVPSLVTRPFSVEVHDTGPLDRRSKFIINAIVLVLLAAPFFGGIAMASDSTAGERERFSLLPLLAQPVHPLEIAVGKWMAVSVAAGLGSVATALGGAFVIERVPLANLGLSLGLDLRGAAVMAALLVPLSLSVAAAQLLIALGSRTYKEGQTYLTMLSFLPFLVVLVASSKMGGRLAEMPLPLFWEMDSIGRLLGGQSIGGGGALLAAMAHVALAALMLLGVAHQLRRAAVKDG